MLTEPSVTVPSIAAPNAVLDARNAFVYDCGTGELLCAKGQMTTRLHPASITKLFTVYVALQYLAPDRQITAGEILNTVPIDSSFAGLEIGDVLTTEQLVAAMLLPSGNDAAKVMAVEVGRVIAGDPDLPEKDAQAAFVDEMNRQTEILGLENSHFSCPDGYNYEEHYTCMADLLTISRLCMDIPMVRQITATPTYELTLENGRTFSWRNTNMLVWEDSPYYNPYAIGLKTGFTNDAGNCVIAVFHIDGRDLIVGVLGCSSIRARFEDALALFNEYA